MHDLRKIEQFLYDEASLLDQPDLDSWMALYTEDGNYWMPVAVDQADPINHVSLFYDCLLYTSPSPRDRTRSRMPSSA